MLISCFDPLRIYLFKDGLTRFATSNYNTNFKKSGKFDSKQKYVHLTNYAVNRKNSNFVKSSVETDGQGSKWTLKVLR